jgi:vacuolar-type H+-ATPase subunit D/Vma8
MPKLEVAPTRSNLLKTRESLELAKEGYDLLEQKREVLLMELMQIVHDLRELERQVEEKSLCRSGISLAVYGGRIGSVGCFICDR